MFEQLAFVKRESIPVSMIAAGGRTGVCAYAGTPARRGHTTNDSEPVAAPAAGGMTVPRRVPADTAETAVRDHLRHVAGLRPSTSTAADVARRRSRPAFTEDIEAEFVLHAASWAAHAGVEARILAEFGVTRDVLARAGMAVRPASESVRKKYSRRPFTVAQLATRAGVSRATAQRVVNADVASGHVEQVKRVDQRARSYRAVAGTA